MSQTAFEVISKDGKIVYQNFQAIAKKVREDCHHTSLKGRRGIAQSECHAFEGECAKKTCECHLFLIVGVSCNLIVARISVEEAEVT